MRVTVWNEGIHERPDVRVAEVYPDGIHGAIVEALRARLHGWKVGAATLNEPHQGLPQELLEQTGALLWWGHKAHHQVDDHGSGNRRQAW